MKNKIFFVFLIFVFLNFFSVKNYFYNYFGKKEFLAGNMEKSEEFFKKSENIFGKINIGNFYYKIGEFDKSKKIFEEILEKKSGKNDFLINSILGNIFYRIGEKSDSIEEKKSNFKNSIKKYENSLNLKYDKKVFENKKFVEEKLKELEEEKKSDENLQNLDGNLEQKQGFSEELSSMQKEELKEYEQYLQDFQKDFGDYFNKIYEREFVFENDFGNLNLNDW